jgi:prepilin-type N-terminal cleavage/methylation domain-containing protein
MSTLKRFQAQARARRQGKPAFTLLELIVVLLVLGILAAIAVPTFNRVKENSAVRAAQTTLEAAARNGEAIAASDRNASDEDIAEAVESEFTDTAVLTVSVSGDTVTVTQTSGSITASGSVEFVDGVATITDATAGSGGGSGGSSVAFFTVDGSAANVSGMSWNAATQEFTYEFSNTTATHRGLNGTDCAASLTAPTWEQADLRTFAGIWVFRQSAHFGSLFAADAASYPAPVESSVSSIFEPNNPDPSFVTVSGTTTCTVVLDVASLKTAFLASNPGSPVSALWFYLGDWRVNHDPVVLNGI